LQLGLFFILAAMALWIEEISDGIASQMTDHLLAYQIGFLINMVVRLSSACRSADRN
jgi:hypothetical protein